MAMFKNDPADSKAGDTVIGQSVKVEGHFVGEGNVLVDGQLQGSLKTKHNVSIGSTAKVKADVEAVDVHLAGELNGNVKATGKLTITSSARLTGNLEAATLAVEEGAMISGKCAVGAVPGKSVA
jgi:cytoskeletal protein CcmA (bactofilin family)